MNSSQSILFDLSFLESIRFRCQKLDSGVYHFYPCMCCTLHRHLYIDIEICRKRNIRFQYPHYQPHIIPHILGMTLIYQLIQSRVMQQHHLSHYQTRLYPELLAHLRYRRKRWKLRHLESKSPTHQRQHARPLLLFRLPLEPLTQLLWPAEM